MLDVFHLPYDTGATDITIYTGKSVTAGGSWETWCKPRGKTMVSILLIGGGGNGGNGSVGASGSGNAGGGGGGSGAQVRITMPLILLPDQLYLSLTGPGVSSSYSLICIYPNLVANHCLVRAASGANGGNATGATVGGAGAAGVITGAATMPLGWQWATALAGQAGGAGGGNQAAGGAAAAPTTGLRCTGGGGGGGMDSSVAASGMAGGATGTAALLLNPGGATTASATTPATRGNPGSQVGQLWFWLGGSGGAGQYNVPTGAGLQQSSGGNGNYGCGGGATGAAVVGSTAGTPGNGGPAWCSIVCW